MSDEALFAKMVTEQEAVDQKLTIRYSTAEDGAILEEWLKDPSVQGSFPMDGLPEIQDAAMRMISFHRIQASLTVEHNGVPCGMAMLYLQAYRKLAHQTEFGIIVGPGMRGKGIGTFLLKSLMRLAKEKFRIELLHLQVYAGNPAVRFYKRMGFREFGRQTHWIKEKDGSYTARIFMERFL